MKEARLKAAITRTLPAPILRWVQRRHLAVWPRVGAVRLGDLRRLHPVSDHFGFDRGLPVDRYYIERFVGAHSEDVRGRVLEIKEDLYASRFGRPRIEAVEILDIDRGNPRATIHGDLTRRDEVPSETFDCVIFTQTLHVIPDFRAALCTLYTALRPGGVLLVTVPGISRGCADEAPTDFWRFTSASVRGLLDELFGADSVAVDAFGNVLAATACLYGLAAEELMAPELDFHDERYEVIVAARAVKRR